MTCDLSTSYLGLELAHPFIMAASSMTATLDGVKKSFDGGASAVVLKSLFEEQINAEGQKLLNSDQIQQHPEAFDYLQQMNANLGPSQYLQLIKDAKKSVAIPIIASINCSTSGAWLDYAKQIQSAGADAIELNIGTISNLDNKTSQGIEDDLISMLTKLHSICTLPMAIKLGQHFSNFNNLASRLYTAGAKGLVLFNRFYQMDISLETMQVKAGLALSDSHEYHAALRWIALLFGQHCPELCASGGIHDATSALKMIAAGAQAVQICSAAFRHGYGIFSNLIAESSTWLDGHAIPSLKALRGKVSRSQSDKPETFERLQYIKAISGIY